VAAVHLGRVLGPDGRPGDRHNAVCVGQRLSSVDVRWRRQTTSSHQRRPLSALRHLAVHTSRPRHRRH